MLRYAKIDNFKSLSDLEFRPSGLNLLVGRNNSGKTNVCQALAFLSTTAQTSLERAVAAFAEPWALTNAYTDSDELSFECECEMPDEGAMLVYAYKLTLRAARAAHLGAMGREISVVSEHLAVSGGRYADGTVLLTNNAGAVVLLQENSSESHRATVESVAPPSATMLSRLYDPEHHRAAYRFRQYLHSWRYYDLDVCRLRSTVSVSPATLMPDGSNLANVLYQLKTTNEREYRGLLEAVREVEPKMDALNFAPPSSPDSVFMFMTDLGNTTFPIQAWSGGTLRYLALAYILLIEARHPRLIMVEEPENGLYVGQLKSLLRLATPDSNDEAQVLFTSHAPYFIDLFDGHLDGIHVARSEGRRTALARPDPAAIEQLLEEFDLGEAHFRGLIQ